ncbi:MAG: hypothetical protein ACOH18_00180 [Candidatus Saccharimonadaceae bacterium]
MAVIKKWDGSGVPDGPLTSASAGSGDTAFSIVSTGLTVSSGNVLVPATTDTTVSYARWNDLSLSAWSTRCYIRFDGNATGVAHIIYAWGTTNARMWSITLNTSRQVELRNVAGSSVGTGPTLTLGVKYRFEVRGQSGTDSVTFKVFNASEVEIYTVTSAIGTTLGLLHVQYGRQQSSIQFGPASYSNFRLDNVNATIGAYVPPAQSTAQWIVTNSNGTTTPLTLNGMWNGSSIIALDAGQVTPISPPPPPTYRTPWQYPFATDSFWNTSVGSGATYLSTSNAQHTQLVDAGGSMNATDWTDPVYLATTSDPLVTVQHVEYLPAGWDNLTNTETGTTTGEGPLVKEYTSIRIPTNAAWQSVNNTDRKVLVVQPNGIDAIEMHKFYRTSNPALIFTTNLSRNDMRYSGLTQGAIASGISPMGGLIRNFEIAAAKAGDIHAISHILKIGLPNRKLIVGQRWPARTDDGDAATAYSGLTQYGQMIVLNKAVDIETLTYNGQPLVPEAKALAYALQDYGGYVLIRGGSGPIGLQAEPRFVDTAAVNNMKNVWSSVLVPLMRIVTNSHQVGTLDAQRVPLNPALIAGGGTRRRPDLPDISPTGPW